MAERKWQGWASEHWITQTLTRLPNISVGLRLLQMKYVTECLRLCMQKWTAGIKCNRSVHMYCALEQSKRNYVNRHHRFMHTCTKFERYGEREREQGESECRVGSENAQHTQLTWINKGNDEINQNVKHCIQKWVTIGRVTVFFYINIYLILLL